MDDTQKRNQTSRLQAPRSVFGKRLLARAADARPAALAPLPRGGNPPQARPPEHCRPSKATVPRRRGCCPDATPSGEPTQDARRCRETVTGQAPAFPPSEDVIKFLQLRDETGFRLRPDMKGTATFGSDRIADLR